MGLTYLPAELVLGIADFLPDGSLGSLIQTQRRLALILIPSLYKRLFDVDTGDKFLFNRPFKSIRAWRSQIILDFFRESPAYLFDPHKRGSYLLHYGAYCGNSELVEILLGKGLDINEFHATKLSRTPLDMAIEGRQEIMVLRLLDLGAYAVSTVADKHSLKDLSYRFHCWPTIIQKSFENLHKHEDRCPPELLRDFLPHNFGLNPRKFKSEVLHYVVFEAKNESVVRTLLDCGGDPLFQSVWYKRTALEGARNQSMRRLLLEHLSLDQESDPQRFHDFLTLTNRMTTHNNWSEVHCIFQKVLDTGFDIKDWPCGDGWRRREDDEDCPSVLYRFAYRGCADAIKFLIEHGADVYVATTQGFSLLHYVLDNCPSYWSARHVCYNIPLEKNEEMCITIIEAIKNDTRVFNHTVPSQLGPLEGGTSLHLAVRDATATVVQLLIDMGVETQVRDDEGRLAIDIAKLEGRKDLVPILSGKGDGGSRKTLKGWPFG